MYEQAIFTIQEYIDLHWPELDTPCQKYKFDTRSYSRWAANEIIDRLILEDSKLPSHITGKEPKSVVDIIEEFIRELNYCFSISDDVDRQEMFNIAVFSAEYILHLFLKGEDK